MIALPLAVWLALADVDPVDAGAPSDETAEVAPASARAAARTAHTQAMARLRAGKLDEAAKLFAAAVANDPGNAALETDLGFALGRLGRRDEAETVLRGAIEKDPHRFYAYVNLAELWTQDPRRWDRREALVPFLEKGLDALKDDPKGRFNLLLALAGFERASGRTAAARARLEPLVAPDAAPLTRAQRKRVLDLLDGIAFDQRANALGDWPAPPLGAEETARLDAADRARAAGRPEDAIAALDPILRRFPGAARARLIRARALEAIGRVDEAARDLEIAVNLTPSSAEAWRALGRLLAAHGGALELDRADEALRQALTLEPAWLDLRDLRGQLARRRAVANAATPTHPRTAPPTERARALYQEGEDWLDVGDPIGLGRELIEKALAESPGFVAAAMSLYALTGSVPPATIAALHDDGPALWALASGVRKLGQTSKKNDKARTVPSRDTTEALVQPWIDRAIELDVQEARFSRALARAGAGDRAGALADLTAYVAREPNPERLADARALRAGLEAPPGTDPGPSPALLARIRLLEDRPDAAARALGGKCAAGLPADRLLALGLVAEYGERLGVARGCYELAGEPALARLARLDARLPDADLAAADRRPLLRAAHQGVGAGAWALARLEAAAGDEATALVRAERALEMAAAAPNDADVWIPAARAAAARWSAARDTAETAIETRRHWIGIGGLLVGLGGLYALARRRWRGKSVAAALRRHPELYPEVARAIGELRHDVLKHRAGVLGMVADPNAPRAEIARALLEPRPTSLMVTDVYEHLVQAARGVGVTLRRLPREPVFGPLVADLFRAELLLSQELKPLPAPPAEVASAADEGPTDELLEIDARLRGDHADALADLLLLGPRTRLDATALAGWIAAAEASARQAGGGWAATALALADLDVDFPVAENALAAIFANLLRNAQQAVAGQPDARVLVRVDRIRDVTGRQAVTLFVGDSAAAPLTLETIEARESGRGLAIVRDLVRAWRGHLVVRPEPAPFTKLVGASFPL
jgi:tetratricopeptide (TPR) repeat protein